MIVFRQADSRYPFLWSDASQPAARWHGAGEGPAHYFADTPEGAWAELIRHEEITDPDDLATLRRALWVVDIGDEPLTSVSLPRATITGGHDTYEACRAHAQRLRARGVQRLVAPSAALLRGGASGVRVVDGVEQPAAARDGQVIVVFDAPAAFIGWKVVTHGTPPAHILTRVHHFS